MKTKNDPLKSPRCLYTSIWCKKVSWELCSWTQTTVHENRPDACIQASGAQPYLHKPLYEPQEWSTRIAQTFVYKHLVHNRVLRNPFMNTNNGPRTSPRRLYTSIWHNKSVLRTMFVNTYSGPPKSPRRLYTSIWCTTVSWETLLWTQWMVHKNRPDACIQASGAQPCLHKPLYECYQIFVYSATRLYPWATRAQMLFECSTMPLRGLKK